MTRIPEDDGAASARMLAVVVIYAVAVVTLLGGLLFMRAQHSAARAEMEAVRDSIARVP